MDITYIHDLRVETIIGIYDWEREQRQTVTLDLEMGCDIALASASEDIRDALDYKAISDRLTTFIEGSRFLLVETLAEEVARIVLQEFQVPWLRVRVGKPGAIPNARDVGVIIERRARTER